MWELLLALTLYCHYHGNNDCCRSKWEHKPESQGYPPPSREGELWEIANQF